LVAIAIDKGACQEACLSQKAVFGCFVLGGIRLFLCGYARFDPACAKKVVAPIFTASPTLSRAALTARIERIPRGKSVADEVCLTQ
jgi:hypothetical protein